jgi:hypothetical protein
MTKKLAIELAVRTDGRCDLSGRPCLQALNLAHQLALASTRLGESVAEEFALSADVDIPGCLRACQLSVALAKARVTVSHSGHRLASVDLAMTAMGRVGATAGAFSATNILHAH